MVTSPRPAPLWLRSVLSVLTWVEIAIVCVVGCVCHWFVLALTYPFDRQRRLSGRFYRLIAVWAIKLSPMWTAKFYGLVPDRIRGRTVVVSNHVSHLDSFLIAKLPWEMKWLAKRSLFKIPFVGWNMFLAGDIGVVRGSRDSAVAAMQRCATYLQHDMPLCIFPEGTRATGTELLPFKDGAFRLAIENGADILPVAVTGTQRGLPKHSWRFDFSCGIIAVGQPISTQGMSIDQLEALKAATRQAIEALLVQIRRIERGGFLGATP